MPLDMTNDIIESVPNHLDFGISYEQTKFDGKKYVINDVTGDYLGIVGKDFTCADHRTFFHDIQETIVRDLKPHEVQDAKIHYQTAKNNAWALMDITFPNLKTTITTSKHQTEVAQRVIALHGMDGSCSNQTYFGAIDFFCTNGLISGEYDKIRKKNTSNFCMDAFIAELKQAKTDFETQTERLKMWAIKDLSHVPVKEFLENLMKSESNAEKMFTLYNQEVGVRGRNLFALYSAFTNYATYADERNGFHLRNTGMDTDAQRMHKREHEVAKWIDTPMFKQLEAA